MVTFPPPVYLAGPTAVGKSAVAMELARRLNGEILSVDSMQVYRGLDIGTAKPSAAERSEVPHHLLNLVEVHQSFDVAQFIHHAREVAGDIQQRGRVPIFCGGTGYYFKAYLEGVGDAPAPDPELRRELEAVPVEKLLEELKQRDPMAYEKIDRANPRRVRRAVEVIRSTGKPFWEQRARWEGPGPGVFLVALGRESEDLRQRIEQRVELMFAAGLVEETVRLLAAGLEQNRTALQAIGYRQVVDHLRGRLSLAQAVEEIKQRTRQLARRQRTWLRHQLPCPWVMIPAGREATQTASQVLELAPAELKSRLSPKALRC